METVQRKSFFLFDMIELPVSEEKLNIKSVIAKVGSLPLEIILVVHLLFLEGVSMEICLYFQLF